MRELLNQAVRSPHRDDHPARIPAALEVIPDRWYVVLRAKDLRRKPLAIRRLGEDLVLYRTASGTPTCVIDRCPHRGVALSLGRVVGDELECGYHGFRFRTDGSCSSMPCDGRGARIPKAMRATTFPIREAHGLLWVWWGTPRAELPGIPWISDLPTRLDCAADLAVEWPVPSYRAIQANLDPHHAAFLHGPRSLFFTPVRRLVQADEVRCESNDEGVDVWMVMREAGGRGPSLPIHASHRVPGVSYVRLGKFGLLGILDTPIDAERTFRVIRNVSPFGRAGGLGKLYAWASIVLDYYVGSQLKEDLPFVRTQASPSAQFVDTFAAADVGVARYEQLRRALLRAARERAAHLPAPVRLRLPVLRQDEHAQAGELGLAAARPSQPADAL
jgi:nitrite reductase/ring-hydroxylating ferredoxin subunit